MICNKDPLYLHVSLKFIPRFFIIQKQNDAQHPTEWGGPVSFVLLSIIRPTYYYYITYYGHVAGLIV